MMLGIRRADEQPTRGDNFRRYRRGNSNGPRSHRGDTIKIAITTVRRSAGD